MLTQQQTAGVNCLVYEVDCRYLIAICLCIPNLPLFAEVAQEILHSEIHKDAGLLQVREGEGWTTKGTDKPGGLHLCQCRSLPQEI